MSDWQSFRFAQKSHAFGGLLWLFLSGVIVSMWGFGFTMHSLLSGINARADNYQVYTLAVIAGIMLVMGLMIGLFKLVELVHNTLQLGISIGRLKTDPAADSETVKFLTDWYEENPKGLLLRAWYGLPVDPSRVPVRPSVPNS